MKQANYTPKAEPIKAAGLKDKPSAKLVFLRKLETFAKALLSTTLTLWIVEAQQGKDLFSGGLAMWKALLTAGLVANLPIIINWLNPNYDGYGRK